MFLCGSALNCAQDARIYSAAADVALHRTKNLIFARVSVRVEQRNRRHDHPRCAVGALHRIFMKECSLHGMKLVTVSESFDRGDALLSDGSQSRYARPLRFAVEQNRAGATLALAATILRAGEIEVFAEDCQ